MFFRALWHIRKSLALTLSAMAFLALLSSCTYSEGVESGDTDLSCTVSDTVFLSHSGVSVSAASAVLMDASSGLIIASVSPDERRPMASTTKIMTAIVALECCDIQKKIKVSKDAVGIEGSSVYLYAEEELTLEDLLYALLLESANDAAAAIAIDIGGSIEGFANLMNEKAEALGLKNTHFTNPHGLDDDGHYTTARELATITRYALENEDFARIASTYKKTIPLNGGEGERLLINHNKLLRSYDGIIGVKTGYTKKSGRCLVSAAEKDGMRLICVTLSAPDDWNDHQSLLDYGFSSYSSRLLCSKGEIEEIVPVVGGNAEYVIATNKSALKLTLPQSASVECRLELPSFEYAPVSEGDRIGTAVFFAEGEEIARMPLYANFSVGEANHKRLFFEWFISLFNK